MNRVTETLELLHKSRFRYERPALAIGGLAFLVGLVLSIRSLDLDLSSLRWHFLALALAVGVPATMLTNAFEVTLAGRFLRLRVPFRSALRVGIVGTAANLLPIPGAVLVRSADLISRGGDVQGSTRGQIGIGLVWSAVSSASVAAVSLRLQISGSSLWLLSAAIFFAIGVLVLPTRSLRLVLVLIALEAVSVAVTALRINAIWAAIDLPTGGSAGIVVAAANALSALVWVLPGGLGVRELLGGGLAGILGLPAAAGFTAQGVDRAIGLIGHLLALVFVLPRTSQARKQNNDTKLFD